MSKFNDLKKNSFINKVQEYSEGKKVNLSERVTFTMDKRYIDILNVISKKDRLSKFGLSARRKLLFIGSPGTGKTMSAAVLATELKLPLYTIVLDNLITRFMGETAAKLRLIFDHIKQTRAVYLFDEFDAICKKRGSRGSDGTGVYDNVVN